METTKCQKCGCEVDLEGAKALLWPEHFDGKKPGVSLDVVHSCWNCSQELSGTATMRVDLPIHYIDVSITVA